MEDELEDNLNKGLDFMEYFDTGEENPIEPEEHQGQIIDEGLVDVIFKSLKTNLRTKVRSSYIYFRWEWMGEKTVFSLKIRKTTLEDMLEWLNEIIYENKDEEE